MPARSSRDRPASFIVYVKGAQPITVNPQSMRRRYANLFTANKHSRTVPDVTATAIIFRRPLIAVPTTEVAGAKLDFRGTFFTVPFFDAIDCSWRRVRPRIAA
jgi:hypothetical protein